MVNRSETNCIKIFNNCLSVLHFHLAAIIIERKIHLNIKYNNFPPSIKFKLSVWYCIISTSLAVLTIEHIRI